MYFGNVEEVCTHRKAFVCPEYMDLIQHRLMFFFNVCLLSTIMCNNKVKHMLFNLNTFMKFNELLSAALSLVHVPLQELGWGFSFPRRAHGLG